MAQQNPSPIPASIGMYAADPTYADGLYKPVLRPDQLQAITQYFKTGVKKQSVPHQSGSGTFDVIFDGTPEFSYTKMDGKGTKVKVAFADPNQIAMWNRFMMPPMGGGPRRATKRSKKLRRKSRRHNK